MSQNFRLFHVPIEFIRSKLSNFSAHEYGVIDDINHLLLTGKLGVLCLSETWLAEAMDDRTLIFPGYAIRRDRCGRSGGGVAILHRSDLPTELLTVPSTDSALESLWMQLTDSPTGRPVS